MAGADTAATGASDAGADQEESLPAAGVSPSSRRSPGSPGPLTARSPRAMSTARSGLLAIDSQIHEWAADTLDSDEQDRARETLRRYVVRLGDLARNGVDDPRELLGRRRPVLSLRVEMRVQGSTRLRTSCATRWSTRASRCTTPWRFHMGPRRGADGLTRVRPSPHLELQDRRPSRAAAEPVSLTAVTRALPGGRPSLVLDALGDDVDPELRA